MVWKMCRIIVGKNLSTGILSIRDTMRTGPPVKSAARGALRREVVIEKYPATQFRIVFLSNPLQMENIYL
jgi:hypothetical protein